MEVQKRPEEQTQKCQCNLPRIEYVCTCIRCMPSITAEIRCRYCRRQQPRSFARRRHIPGSERRSPRTPISSLRAAAFTDCVNSGVSGGRWTLTRWPRSSMLPSNSPVDYCNTVLAGAPRTVTDKLQRMLNAAARVITGTRKFDRGLGQIPVSYTHLTLPTTPYV